MNLHESIRLYFEALEHGFGAFSPETLSEEDEVPAAEAPPVQAAPEVKQEPVAPVAPKIEPDPLMHARQMGLSAAKLHKAGEGKGYDPTPPSELSHDAKVHYHNAYHNAFHDLPQRDKLTL